MSESALWFRRPASTWTEALPLGNGTIGAMVFGGAGRERLQINDGRAWSGSPRSEEAEPRLTPPAARSALADTRQALAAADPVGAMEALKGFQHRHSQSYLAFADLELTLDGGAQRPAEADPLEGYSRRLDLSTAVHESRYRWNGSPVTQTTFISHAAGVLVQELVVEGGAGIEVELRLSSALRVTGVVVGEPGGAGLELDLPSDVIPPHDGVEAEPVRYSDDGSLHSTGAVVVRWQHDGREEHPQADGDAAVLRAHGVHRLLVYLSTGTSFAGLGRMPQGSVAEVRRAAEDRVAAAAATGREPLLRRHRDDHRALYSRVEFSIEGSPADALPLEERLETANRSDAGALSADPGLAALLFDYGRYLLISSSRPGGVPANLQGIWNDALQPPWSSNYTTNINLEMNYWQAEVVGLPELVEPLFDLIDALTVTGGATAGLLYESPGWVAHHNTDIWAYSLPVGEGKHDPRWAFWPLGGAWLVRHLWEHLRFGCDDDFARSRAWQPIRGAAEFLLHWLQERPDGRLGTAPSTSPENGFSTPDGRTASVGESSALDMTLIADVFDMVAALASALGETEDPVVVAARAARRRLVGVEVGADGLIEEWAGVNLYPQPHHRHQSHLYFVFPGAGVASPELLQAASRSLDARGDESTGWSLAWKLALRARLREPQKVSDLLRLFFRSMHEDRGSMSGGLYGNLFAAHPPFQIDGNLGFVAALAECLVQSHAGEIDLLPSLPVELARGSISGLVARPGILVSMSWAPDEHGVARLQEARLRARTVAAAGPQVVRLGDRTVVREVPADRELRLTAEDFEQADRSLPGRAPVVID